MPGLSPHQLVPKFYDRTIERNKDKYQWSLIPLKGRAYNIGSMATKQLRPGDGFNKAVNDMRREELLRLVLGGLKSLEDCAHVMNLSRNTVFRAAREPEFLQKLREMDSQLHEDIDKQLFASRKQAYQRIEELSMMALDRMEELVHSDREIVALKACADILDRNVETPRNKHVQADVNTRVFDPAALIHAATVANELQRLHEETGDGKTTLEAGD